MAEEIKNVVAKRRQFIKGVVVSDKMAKTRVVEVRHSNQHRLYKKKMIKKQRFFIHDEKNVSKVGDTVLALATRPISKNKNFVLSQVVEKRTAE